MGRRSARNFARSAPRRLAPRNSIIVTASTRRWTTRVGCVERAATCRRLHVAAGADVFDLPGERTGIGSQGAERPEAERFGECDN